MMNCEMTGACPSDAHAQSLKLCLLATTTKTGGLIARLCKAESRRLLRRECAMVTDASMYFCVVKADR